LSENLDSLSAEDQAIPAGHPLKRLSVASGSAHSAGL